MKEHICLLISGLKSPRTAFSPILHFLQRLSLTYFPQIFELTILVVTIDDYADDGGSEVVSHLWGFYHDPLPS